MMKSVFFYDAMVAGMGKLWTLKKLHHCFHEKFFYENFFKTSRREKDKQYLQKQTFT